MNKKKVKLGKRDLQVQSQTLAGPYFAGRSGARSSSCESASTDGTRSQLRTIHIEAKTKMEDKCLLALGVRTVRGFWSRFQKNFLPVPDQSGFV